MNQDETRAATARLARLESYLEGDPENDHLRAEVFDAALSAGRLDVATQEVKRALSRDPSHAAWEHRRALVLLASKDYANAQVAFEGLIARGERAPAVHHNLAFALFSQGNREAAARVLEPLLEQTEGAALWTLWLRCQHHLDRIRPALAAFRVRLAAGPASAEALGVASLMALDSESLREADEWSSAALRAREGQHEALVTRGTLALAALDAAGALAWFSRALDASPGDGRTWSGVAFAKMLSGDLEGAGPAFASAVRTMPDHVGTWIGWGWLAVMRQQHEDALARFQEALRIDHNFGESHGCAAVALARLGRREAAEQEVEVALRLDPKGLAARYAQAVLAGKGEDPGVVKVLGRLGMRWGQEHGK